MSYRSPEPCVVTGEDQDGCVCYHHIYHRSGHPEYKEKKWNMIPVSSPIHTLWHKKGTIYMADTFPSVEKWLMDHEWYLDQGKWRHEP